MLEAREQEARLREEMARRNAEAEAHEEAERQRLAAAKAEFQLAAGQILRQATGGERPSQEWLVTAAAAGESAHLAWERRIRKVEETEPVPDDAARVRREALRPTAERQDEPPPVGDSAGNPPPLAKRALGVALIIPLLLVIDVTLALATYGAATGTAVAPEPLSKAVFVVSDIVILGADVLVGFAHISLAHYVVTGELIHSWEDWADWQWRP